MAVGQTSKDAGDWVTKYVPRRSKVGNTFILLLSSDWEGVVNHHSTHVIVVVGGRRSMNEHRATDTVSILGEGVRVIPTSAKLLEVHGVGTGAAWCDGTLGDTGNTILVVCSLLEDTCDEVSEHPMTYG